MSKFDDPEFGTVHLTTSPLARYISLKLTPDRQLRLTSRRPLPVAIAKAFVSTHRSEIRKMINQSQPNGHYQAGDQIGQHHIIKTETGPTLRAFLRNNYLVVTLPTDVAITEPSVQRTIYPVVIRALKQQAHHVLPQRLKFLAAQHGFSYQRHRLSHASTRWGSCSSNGTISLNIALMKLSTDLINYVIIHELCHTRQPNHSAAFWREVELILPNYRALRAELKTHSPIV